MKNPLGTPVRSLPRRTRIALPALVLLGGLTLAGCATPMPGGPAAPGATVPQTPTPTPASSTSTSPSAAATPAPSASATADAPYNGEVLVVTSEVRDGRLEVSAMVPGVSEAGGTCTLTLTSTGETVSVAGNEGKDVTYCGLMSIDAGSSAEVSFTVAYSSTTLRARSDIATVETAP